MGWHAANACGFTFVSFALAVVYLILVLLVVRHLTLLARESAKRKAQKIFLSFVVLQCVGRLVFFVCFPFTSDSCRPVASNKGGGSIDTLTRVLDVFGTLPACFFLTAFSVLVYTFARIYHTVLRPTRVNHEIGFRLVVWFALIINVTVYISTILEYTVDTRSDLSIWVLSSATFLVAIGFVAYGVMLFYAVEHVLHNTQSSSHNRIRRGSGASSPILGGSSSAAGAASSASSSAGAHSSRNPQHYGHGSPRGGHGGVGGPGGPGFGGGGIGAGPAGYMSTASVGMDPSRIGHDPVDYDDADMELQNPMKRIAAVSIICLGCFLVRVILLPVVQTLMSDEYNWLTTVVYFTFSEILPLSLMLFVFDIRPTSATGAHIGAAATANNSLLAPKAHRSEQQQHHHHYGSNVRNDQAYHYQAAASHRY